MTDNNEEKNDNTNLNNYESQALININPSDVVNIENKPKPDCVNLEDELKGEFKVDCTPLQKLLGIEKMEYVSAGVCAFFHALSDTIAVSLESQIIEMMDEILYKKGQDDTSNLITQNGGLEQNRACRTDNAAFAEDVRKIENCKDANECKTLNREYYFKYHPDKNGECPKKATEYFVKINEINEINSNKKNDSSSSTQQDPNKTETFNKFETAIQNMKFKFDTNDSVLFMDGEQSMQNELEKRIITEIKKQLESQTQKADNLFMKTGGQRRYSKKLKTRYGNKKNKTQKGGERGYEIPLKLPKHFWEKLISDLRVYLAQAINELISCEALKKHLVSGIYTCADNNFHGKIQYDEYKRLLNDKIEKTVKITNESLDTKDKANDYEFKKKLAQRLILSKQDKK